MTPSWYDVLGVEPDADQEKIRSTFKAEIADLDPTDRRFRLLSRAAEVLLDPERRAAHDVELAAQEAADEHDEQDREREDSAAAEPAATPVSLEKTSDLDSADLASDSGADVEPSSADPSPRSGAGPLTVLALALVALLLATATVVSFVRGGDAPSSDVAGLPDSRQVAAARAAAEAAIVPVTSYDYRSLEDSKAAALGYVTPAFGEELTKIFDGVIAENAPSTQTVVQARLLASGISRTGEGRVDVVLFVDQSTTNKQTDEPQVYKNQAIAQMVDVDGTWLLDCLVTTPGGGCDR